MTKSIGFIGLGVLGSVMAANLLENGFSVFGYDIRTGVLNKLKNPSHSLLGKRSTHTFI